MIPNAFIPFKRLALILGLVGGAVLPWALLEGAEAGASVVVVYNTRLPESKEVADHYASRRQVPANQVFGLELPVTETMTRKEFIEQLEQPLLKRLQTQNLFTFGWVTNQAGGKTERQRQVIEAKVRFAVLCYGVPVKVLPDPGLVEPGADQLRVELRRNEASVDSQLACLPLSEQKPMWAGALNNPLYGATNASLLHPTNGVLMVARLDGPTAAIARGLVDKALQAEADGLWGRAYFDTRGLTNGEYRLGDDWLRSAAMICRRMGYETEVDENPGTFPASHPMSQIAFYAGWYDGQVSGPFTRPQVEFMPGAFAYHLHSFSAQTLRSPTAHWAGPLLDKGATITLGCVEEPYLTGTPNIHLFFGQFMFLGFRFGEAAYACQSSLSWQTTVVGDPLYRPFGRRPDLLHAALEQRQSKLVEWSHLGVANLNLVQGYPAEDAIGYLEQIPVTRQSAVLKEKLADLYWSKRKLLDALNTYDDALKLDSTPQQKLRLLLTAASRRAQYGSHQPAYDLYQRLLREFPDYPNLLAIYRQLLPLAEKLEKKEDLERYQQEIKRLTPTAPKPSNPD